MNENFGESRGLGGMYSSLNEKSELQRFRDKHGDQKLSLFVEDHGDLWREAFRHNHEDLEAPFHPWKVLKWERRAYAELNDGSWPSMARRHALRVVKDEFTAKWRELAYE
jgi:hypothetical protein